MRRLLRDLQTLMPGRRIFFIYTHDTLGGRFVHGLKANTEISYWCYRALRHQFSRVYFLRSQNEKPWRVAQVGPRDVVIGHVGETFSLASSRTQRVIAFYPWAGHPDRSENTLFNCYSASQELSQLTRARSVVLLTSEYNKRRYIDQAGNHWHDYWKERRLRVVHQPVDLSLFRRVKHNYTTSNFLYIGNDAHMKCLDHSRSLVQAVGRQLHIYGLPGRKIDHLDQSAVLQTAQEADFFIQPGMWEAQSVAILEAAARGFIPIVSPETGYPYHHPFLLRYGDYSYNLRILRDLLATHPDERRQLADSLLTQLHNDIHHNQWEQLTRVLIEEVAALR